DHPGEASRKPGLRRDGTGPFSDPVRWHHRAHRQALQPRDARRGARRVLEDGWDESEGCVKYLLLANGLHLGANPVTKARPSLAKCRNYVFIGDLGGLLVAVGKAN